MFITSPGRCIQNALTPHMSSICLPYVRHPSPRRDVLFLLYLAPAFDYLFCACKTNLLPACEHGQRRPRYRAPNFNPSVGPVAPRLQGGAMRPPSQARCIVTSCAAITESRSIGGSGPLPLFPGSGKCQSSSHCVFMLPNLPGHFWRVFGSVRKLRYKSRAKSGTSSGTQQSVTDGVINYVPITHIM